MQNEMQTAGTAQLAGVRVLANHPHLKSRLVVPGVGSCPVAIRGCNAGTRPTARLDAHSPAGRSQPAFPPKTSMQQRRQPRSLCVDQQQTNPFQTGHQHLQGRNTHHPFLFLLKQHCMEFLGTATRTLSLLRILLSAAGNNLCPELAQQEQHPLQDRGCTGIQQQQHCPEEEPRSLSPPFHLPFSVLTFLAPSLKQLNSLDFFFLPPSPVRFSV